MQTVFNSKFASYMVIFSHLIVVYENILNGFIRMIYIINKSDSHDWTCELCSMSLLTPQPPQVTKTEILLTISLQYQPDE